jgi:hypothetical protein
MADIDDRLREHFERRKHLPGSIAAMETKNEAETINRELALLENYLMRLSACWDGEMDAIGAYSQLAYLHEKAEGAESAARSLREAVERLTGWAPMGQSWSFDPDGDEDDWDDDAG